MTSESGKDWIWDSLYWDSLSPTTQQSILESRDKEFVNDCYRVKYGMLSTSGTTRYETKQDAQDALDKMLEGRRKQNKKTESQFVDSLRKDIDEMKDTNCKQCGKPTLVRYYEYYNPECNECNLKRRKIERDKYCEEQRIESERYPIIKYVHDIRSIAQDWEITFEMQEQDEKERGAEKYVKQCSPKPGPSSGYSSEFVWEKNKNVFTKHFAEIYGEGLRTGKITKQEYIEKFEKEWNKVRHKKHLNWEISKQHESDWNFQFKNSPIQQYEQEILWKIHCDCTSENKVINVCKTCKLMLKVREYTLNLFKDAAQGRSSIV